MNDKIKVLFLSANATDKSIRPEVSIREIEEGIKRGEIREKFDFVPKTAVTTRDISREILNEKPDIVHFSAKGENLNSLIVEAEDGSGPKTVKVDALADLFQVINERHPVRCVVIAAAVSKEALDAIFQHVPFVIGMSRELDHKGVRSFEVGFYDGLVAGETIPFSFSFACRGLGMEDHDTSIPQIHKRDDDKGEIKKAILPPISPSATASDKLFDRKIPRPRHGFISCNRDTEMELLTGHFEKHKDQTFQHYFIHGHRNDKPESLVERFIHEVLAVGKYEFDYPVAHENNQHPVLAPVQLRIMENEHVVQSQVCGCFLQRFFHPSEHTNTRISTLEDFFQSNKPILQKDYCIWVFKFDGSRKDTVIPNLIRWIVNKFCCGKSPRVKFLFFYIFEGVTTAGRKNLMSLFGKKQSDLLQHIKEISAQENIFCCHVPGMSRVNLDDVMKWFDRHSSKTLDAEMLLDKAIQNYDKHYDEKTSSFPMHVVENFLEEIMKKFTARAF
ncbi:MAG: hypothetical protein R3D00_18120 [Bacteroidia bacterium]